MGTFTVECWDAGGNKTGEFESAFPRFTKGTVRDTPRGADDPTRCHCGHMNENAAEAAKCWTCGDKEGTE
jgi:hypothetical protein